MEELYITSSEEFVNKWSEVKAICRGKKIHKVIVTLKAVTKASANLRAVITGWLCPGNTNSQIPTRGEEPGTAESEQSLQEPEGAQGSRGGLAQRNEEQGV